MRAPSICAILLLGSAGVAGQQSDLREALLFHASFDTTVEADFAKGDPKLYTAESLKREKVRPGLHSEAVVLDKTNGRFGGSLSFRSKSDQVIFYRGARNLPYGKGGFQGTISFWMQLSPADDLPPGYVDPLQITDKTWNDASFFVDFTQKNPRQFRLGVFSDYKFWNPQDRKWEDIPDAERPLVNVVEPPFSRSRWTHVAITYRGFNSTEAQGDAVLYLDGRVQGHVRGKQRYTWNPQRVVIMLGINYVGRMDDFAVFDRALSATEVKQLVQLSEGVSTLR